MLECFEPTAPVSESERRLKIPSDWSDWLGLSFRGCVAYLRNFNLPTGLEAQQKVWLVVSEVDFRACVWLNETPIGEIQLGQPALRVEVRDLLQSSNQLRIEVTLPVGAQRTARSPLAGGLIGEVRIEIEETRSPDAADN